MESHGDTGSDTLSFGDGILAGDISITVADDKLTFAHANGRDRISIANWFESLADATHHLDTVSFSDGTSFDLANLQSAPMGPTRLPDCRQRHPDRPGRQRPLTGDAGNDWLDGGSGADVMDGGAGDDIYVVDNAGDVTIEAAEGGIDTVHSRVSHTLAENIENLRLTGTASISGIGNIWQPGAGQ